MRKLMLSLGSLLVITFTPVHAAQPIDTSNLVKVTGDANQKCVEYYQFKGEMYCSTKALTTSAIDPDLIKQEKQNIVFDERAWQPVWGKKTDSQ